ncbi:MAG: hypothetical protein U0U66_05545 [Cytophagaceae bacterium]
MKLFLLLNTSIFFFISCKSPERIEPSAPSVFTNGVFVVNEGNYQSSNGNVAFINYNTNEVFDNIIKANNPSFTIGDVCQSLYFYNNYYFLVVNNSGKIEIFDSNFHHYKTITNLGSPRFISFKDDLFYVSNINSNTIDIGSVNTLNIISSISTNTWTEEMVVVEDTLYATCPNKDFVLKINLTSTEIVDSIFCGVGNQSIVQQGDSVLWIQSVGDDTHQGNISSYHIKSNELHVVDTWSYYALVSRLCIDNKNQKLYWINKDVLYIPTSNRLLSSTASVVIPGGTKNFYVININPKSSDTQLWISNVKDYVQSSDIEVYDAQYQLTNTFKAGIISGYLLFSN